MADSEAYHQYWPPAGNEHQGLLGMPQLPQTDRKYHSCDWSEAGGGIGVTYFCRWFQDAVKIPTRRLIRSSKEHPLSLCGAGRMSTHDFFLFNDLFVHAQVSLFFLIT